jgi:hypothetical protein
LTLAVVFCTLLLSLRRRWNRGASPAAWSALPEIEALHVRKTCPMTQEETIRSQVEREFGAMTYPQLGIALRAIDDLVMDRMATDPARCYGEQSEYDQACEKAT